ncbi:MAG: UDP-N-acetylglucosamine--N-acetylmuramyl-(pentapeptide) pyrophosphoryl-undecaprenol N-acetylglucosamine transferase, partial [Chlamydiota bacterium]|nr:UDP-N-acetylglucosamine--N-acetylmuramyl-(pentapeptide) pyrophosphoryl-undecaprenol N-acetylglucosamine transferase [Chlamydiota bacterium]
RERWPKVECIFLGTRNGLDQRLLTKKGEKYFGISGSALPRGFGIGFLQAFSNMLRGLLESWFIFRRFKPDIIVAVGSYIALGPVVIGRWKRIPVLLFESNVCMGRANRFLARMANIIASGFPVYEVKSASPKLHFTGHPIRKDLEQATRRQAQERFGLDPDKRTLLVVGGSQGATFINRCMIDAMDCIKHIHHKIQVIHLVGERHFDSLMESYQPGTLSYQMVPYLDDMHLALRAADILISRAGATIIAEAMYCQIPSILIPYPFAMEQHQLSNAKYVSDRGAAVLIKEDSLNAELLAEKIVELIEDQTLREHLKEGCRALNLHNGLNNLVDLIMKMISRDV